MGDRKAPPRVLVVGDVIDDIVVRPLGPVAHGSDTPARIEPTPGGSGANQAVWLAHHGAAVRFVGRVAAADVERHERALARHGVEPHLAGDPAHPTGSIVILVDSHGERSMFTDRGANLQLSAADLPNRLLEDVDHVHVSGYSLFDERVRDVVLTALLRVPGLAGWSVDPASAAFLRTVGPTRFLDWLNGCAVVFPNLDEGRLLTGVDDPEAALDHLLARVPLVALTLGRNGALVAHRDGPRVHAAAPVVEVADTTGAGDAFCGAFLATWLRDGDLVRAANAGVAAGSGCVKALGGRPAPT